MTPISVLVKNAQHAQPGSSSAEPWPLRGEVDRQHGTVTFHRRIVFDQQRRWKARGVSRSPMSSLWVYAQSQMKKCNQYVNLANVMLRLSQLRSRQLYS